MGRSSEGPCPRRRQQRAASTDCAALRRRGAGVESPRGRPAPAAARR